jgi:hypothetical protein
MSRDVIAAPAVVRMSGQVRMRDWAFAPVGFVAPVGAIETVQSGVGVPAFEPPEAVGASGCGGAGCTATEHGIKVQNRLQFSLRATAMAPIAPLVADRRPVVTRGRAQ